MASCAGNPAPTGTLLDYSVTYEKGLTLDAPCDIVARIRQPLADNWGIVITDARCSSLAFFEEPVFGLTAQVNQDYGDTDDVRRNIDHEIGPDGAGYTIGASSVSNCRFPKSSGLPSNGAGPRPCGFLDSLFGAASCSPAATPNNPLGDTSLDLSTKIIVGVVALVGLLLVLLFLMPASAARLAKVRR